jgi:hypothetical protein
MSVKYAIALGEHRVLGFYRANGVVHVAPDNIMLVRLEALGMPPLDIPWSKIADYLSI